MKRARSIRVEWAEAAVGDLEESALFVAADNPAAAVTLGDRIIARVATLAEQPLQGRMVPELLRLGIRRYRELIVAPYRIVYRAEAKRVLVLVVVHGARDIEPLLHRRLVRTGA